MLSCLSAFQSHHVLRAETVTSIRNNAIDDLLGDLRKRKKSALREIITDDVSFLDAKDSGAVCSTPHRTISKHACEYRILHLPYESRTNYTLAQTSHPNQLYFRV